MEETNESGYSEGRKHTMTANQLRVGNWLNLYGQTVTVVGIDRTLHGEYHVTYNDGEKEYRTARYLDQFEPIPLDIMPHLIKKLDGTGFGYQLNFTIWVELEGVMIEQYGEGRELIPHIKHIHQLQNLYFALTGEELTI